MKKKLIEVSTVWQAEFIKENLARRGISAEIQSPPREYSTLITGVGQYIEIFVEESEYNSSLEILKTTESQGNNESKSNFISGEEIPVNYYRKVLFFKFYFYIYLAAGGTFFCFQKFYADEKKAKDWQCSENNCLYFCFPVILGIVYLCQDFSDWGDLTL